MMLAMLLHIPEHLLKLPKCKSLAGAVQQGDYQQGAVQLFSASAVQCFSCSVLQHLLRFAISHSYNTKS